jgi:flagellar motor protein MotB
MDKINEYYEENNFPSAAKLYKIMKKDDIKITLKQIQEFLSKQEVEQVMKQQNKTKSGHIVAMFPNEWWQIDIFILEKYYKYNKGFKYIFCVIDIFSRKVYTVAMKTKDEIEVKKAFSKIVASDSIMPVNILSDSDSAFLSNTLQTLFKKYDINHDVVPVGDHSSLGVIDRFALTLKRILSKYREAYKSANWVDILPKVISTYNNSEHRSLMELSPNEALKEQNKETIVRLNLAKSKSNVIVQDLEPGDKVRIKETNLFKKGSEAQWSSEIYTVDKAIGKTIFLTDGKKKKRDMLLKVHKDTMSSVNITKRITRERRVERKIVKSGVEEVNIVEGKRERKKKIITDV